MLSIPRKEILLIGELNHHIPHIGLSSLAPSSWLFSYSCYSVGTENSQQAWWFSDRFIVWHSQTMSFYD